MTLGALITQLAALIGALAAAPLFVGWISRCRAWSSLFRFPTPSGDFLIGVRTCMSCDPLAFA